MKVGDTAYFKTTASGYVERTVTAIAATTITISGAVVTVPDNGVISNNLRIAIWRSKTSGSTPTAWYLVEEIANNSFAATQAFDDNTTDANLGALLIPPATDRSVPPLAKYVSQWNGQLVLAGIRATPNLVAWSDIDGQEYFPSDTNQLDCQSSEGDKIAGIAPNNEVFAICKDNSFGVLSGDITSGLVRFDIKARNIGCIAHATIQDINGTLVWASRQGPVKSSGGQVPTPLGIAESDNGPNASRIDPVFNVAGLSSVATLKFKRAIGYNDTNSQKYILFLPAETTTGGNNHANINSRTFAYDYSRDAWLEWSNLNLAGGMTALTDDVIFQGRVYSTYASAIISILFRQHNLADAYDYADHITAVGGATDGWQYAPQWEALGEPAILKHAEKLRVYSLEDTPNNSFTLTVQQELNYQKDAARASFPIVMPGSGYGASAWSTDSYGDPAEAAVNCSLVRDRMRSTRFIFKNSTIHENVILTGWEAEFSAPFRQVFKK
jgi:hypothetical protein